MQVSVSDIVVMASAGCGVLMVAGSLWLLYCGAIKLERAAKEGALEIKLFEKIRFTTGVPALGLFLIGWLFIGLAVYRSPPSDVSAINFTGTMDMPYPEASVLVAANSLSIPALGTQLVGVARPTLEYISFTVTAPGYDNPNPKVVRRATTEGPVDLGRVKLTRVTQYHPPPPNSPESLRPEPDLPSPDHATFGVGSQP